MNGPIVKKCLGCRKNYPRLKSNGRNSSILEGGVQISPRDIALKLHGMVRVTDMLLQSAGYDWLKLVEDIINKRTCGIQISETACGFDTQHSGPIIGPTLNFQTFDT
ncbi:MAG: hypothetical protein EBQ96_02405 [Proteobacteria bacterium]|nr:hypothetical protein [Pseudomonadota bacterium]